MGRHIQRVAAAIVVLMISGFTSGQAQAAEQQLIRLIASGDNAFSRDTAIQLRIQLEDSVPGIVLQNDGAAMMPETVPHLVISVGEQAWNVASLLQGNVPILAVLPKRSAYETAEKRVDRNTSAIFLDQPVGRLLNLVSQLKPGGTRVGVVLGPAAGRIGKELQEAAAERGQRLHLETVGEEIAVGRVLAGVLRDTNVLLAIPDPVVQTPNTVQPFLLMSYQAGVPVIGYSPSYQRAGAMVSLYATPEQIARQAAEAVAAWRQGKGLPKPQAAKYFTVGINAAVARSLGTTLPEAEALQRKLAAMKE